MKKLLFNISMAVFILLSFHSLSNAFPLPDTGQTECFNEGGYVQSSCAGTGQDGEYTINPTSYTDHGNKTVTDNVTGLMWQKCSVWHKTLLEPLCTELTYDAQTFNWYQAAGKVHAVYNPEGSEFKDVCGSMQLGGHDDWRLPSRKELETLLRYGGNISEGPDLIDISNWSSTDTLSYPNEAWRVYSGYYFIYEVLVESVDKSYLNNVRCVRGRQSVEPSYTDNGNGTVTDNNTGLIWQQSVAGEMWWFSALSYCENLELPPGSGQFDWRMPNIKELMSLLSNNPSHPVIDTTYFPGPTSWYWSSTTFKGGIDPYYDNAWIVTFSYGDVYWKLKHQTYNIDAANVRCVRGGVCANKPVKVGSSAANYDFIQAAYVAAVSPKTIRARAVTLNENLSFASGKIIDLIGGYDCEFTTNIGFTTITGKMTIGGTDTVTISNVIIM